MAGATEINVMSVGAIASSLREIIPAYERLSGDRVTFRYGNPGATIDRLRRADPIDLAIVSTNTWEDVIQTGRVDPASRVDIARTLVGLAVPAGAPKPDISNAACFRKALVEARSIGLGELDGGSTISTALLQALAAAGIERDIRAKAKIYPTGGAIAEAVAAREVDMGINTVSELLSAPGAELVGPVPADFMQFSGTSSAVLAIDAPHPDAARAFIAYLRSPEAIAILRRKGMETD